MIVNDSTARAAGYIWWAGGEPLAAGGLRLPKIYKNLKGEFIFEGEIILEDELFEI
jgi:hypothetical protein